MSFQLPQLQVGQPLTCNSLTVFPLNADTKKPAEYQLAEKAIAAATVQEISEGGSASARRPRRWPTPTRIWPTR